MKNQDTSAFEEMYAKHPVRVEHMSLSLSASDAIRNAMLEAGWNRKRLRKAVGWKTKKLERVLNNKITMKQTARLLFAMGYRANVSITKIPANLREVVFGKPEDDPKPEPEPVLEI